MATPAHDDLVLPGSRILVLLDDASESTGIIFRRSPKGGGHFTIGNDVSDHVLFAPEMSTVVEVDGQEYQAMHANAVVGVIPA